ncbi:MAG: SUMF1/EgtB/PvdO family nonheme iron enzyme [Bryobacter sp.]|nr:SUMF1/EgtB/PvdO family nonheme iron enzyme [Bryobacter sp.]
MSSLWLLAFLAIDFESQVKPVLEQRCGTCHDRAFYFRHKDGIVASMQLAAGAKGAMPPAGPRVPMAEIDLLAAWITEGMSWPVAKQAYQDDLELTRVLRGRIQKTPPTAAGKPYVEKIPGTLVEFRMMPVAGGKFSMGSTAKADEQPVHERTVDGFYMMEKETTWELYRLFMFATLAEEKPGEDQAMDAVSRPTKPYVEMSFGMGVEGYPAISMTHHAANKFAQWVSAKTGRFYRLPTEAEWEYACKAGKTEEAPIEEVGVFGAKQYAKVGTKKPNALGLFDVLGNVMEWTLDQYKSNAYASPQLWVKSETPYPHVARGGNWQDKKDALRCAARVASDPSWKQQDPNLPKSIWYHTDALGLGIRLVRPVKLPAVEEMHAAWNNGVAEEN